MVPAVWDTLIGASGWNSMFHALALVELDQPSDTPGNANAQGGLHRELGVGVSIRIEEKRERAGIVLFDPEPGGVEFGEAVLRADETFRGGALQQGCRPEEIILPAALDIEQRQIMLRHPVILGMLSGLVWRQTGLGLYPPVETLVDMLRDT